MREASLYQLFITEDECALPSNWLGTPAAVWSFEWAGLVRPLNCRKPAC